MLRYSSPVERVLTYATFLSLSIATHMVAILGTRAAPAPTDGGVAATGSSTAGAPVGASDPASRPAPRAGLARSEQPIGPGGRDG